MLHVVNKKGHNYKCVMFSCSQKTHFPDRAIQVLRMDRHQRRRMHLCFGFWVEYSGRHMKRHKCVEMQRHEVFQSSANIECSGSQMRTYILNTCIC